MGSLIRVGPNKKPRLFGGGAYMLSILLLYKGSSSMQCRNNNDYHNNDYRVNEIIIWSAFEHRGLVRTKLLPPFQ